jgi:hypothetical protein
MFITDSGSRNPDPTTETEEERGKICCPTNFCGRKYHKIENYFTFELLTI